MVPLVNDINLSKILIHASLKLVLRTNNIRCPFFSLISTKFFCNIFCLSELKSNQYPTDVLFVSYTVLPYAWIPLPTITNYI